MSRREANDRTKKCEAWWKDRTETGIMLSRPEQIAFITPQGITAKESEINGGSGTFKSTWVSRGHEAYVRAKVEMWRSLRYPLSAALALSRNIYEPPEEACYTDDDCGGTLYARA